MKIPRGYGHVKMSIEDAERIYGPKMHPEFRRRAFAWMRWMNETKGVPIGIGGAWRKKPHPVSYASRMGWSFHQTQRFASGIEGCTAIDFVVAVPGGRHRSPTWSEVASAERFGLHFNVRGEPWHGQPIEYSGYLTWRANGRKDPRSNYPLPVATKPVTTLPKEKPMSTTIKATLDILRKGMSGEDVERMQGLVNAAVNDSTPLKIDGHFGPKTLAELRRAQAHLKVTVDGWCGSQTWRALLGA